MTSSAPEVLSTGERRMTLQHGPAAAELIDVLFRRHCQSCDSRS